MTDRSYRVTESDTGPVYYDFDSLPETRRDSRLNGAIVFLMGCFAGAAGAGCVAAILSVLLLAGAASADAESDIRDRCEAKWPAKYRMQRHCIDRETEAAVEFHEHYYNAIPSEIQIACSEKWYDEFQVNWRMTLHCVKRELEAYESLR
jgi:hypothetical protein